ncbi:MULTISPECIES: Maf family nucleotide pyrophosphatase [Empedobacter]|jgi:septum formation protein|uniref:dTTP/UTP pyrophosphatase n=1 Tax=Empedobacter falsenii TaxID=343874 RepID=A0A376G4A7_9FLAO|nr:MULTISPECIES: Maf family nucleotide pyrophosphatase [Empedobacter]MDH0673211.1 Maf family nucleotide pyrophosphatase [Empedobacter sp. GD03861]MDH1881846.1 Maf family nucleotide pyrophosphatase [Empedobacter sp. GD03797]MDM1040467.1 septum formation protein Maf [Empedobacter brevis]MDM1135407.1 septum formation protein Maf [Empedobacter sp. R750]RRT91797.1 septum formation protein Maf [Empedobacter falsenii]
MLLTEKLKDTNIILASQSPRRKELLAGLGLQFSTISLDIDETFDRNEFKKEQITEYLSAKKAKAYTDIQPNDLIITSDTTVWVDDESLEKASNREEAYEMIKKLNGKTHSVYTSVTIRSLEKEVTFSDETQVTFADLTDEEIYFYIDNYKPFDKAGAYGVQEWIGYIGVDNMNGSYFNVMGLPTHKLYKELVKF